MIKGITFPFSRVAGFVPKPNGQRWGQQFHEYMGLEKITNPTDKDVCDKIYNLPRDEAERIVNLRIDYMN